MSLQWNDLNKSERAKLLNSAGLPAGLSQLSWAGLQKSERAKIEKVSTARGEPKTNTKPAAKSKQAKKSEGKGWHEKQEDVHTDKGIEKKAPIHRQVALEKEAGTALNTPMKKSESTHEAKKEPSQMTLEELKAESMMYDSIIKEREEYIRRSNTPLTGANSGVGALIGEEFNRYTAINDEIQRRTQISSEEAKRRVAEKREIRKQQLANQKPTTHEEHEPIQKDVEKAEKLGAEAFRKGMENIPAHDKDFLEILANKQPGEGIPYLEAWTKGWYKERGQSGTELLKEFQLKIELATTIPQLNDLNKEVQVADESYRFVKVPDSRAEISKLYSLIENKIKSLKVDKAVYGSLINKLREAKTFKEVGDINQEGGHEHMKGTITFDQLQEIYSLVHAKDEAIGRASESAIDMWQVRINTAEKAEEIYEIAREINKSNLSQAYKTQLEALIKKKAEQLFKEAQRKESDFTIVDKFKKKIEQATDVNQLSELSLEVTDDVASGKFAKAKVIPDDVNHLHELINDKMSRIYTERVGTTEEFAKKSPMNLIVISNEINRLRDLNKKIQASYLNQNRKDTLDILINSKISGISALKPKPNVESLDALTNIKESDAYKMLLIKISEFTTLTQLNTFSAEFNRQMKLMGIESLEDPRISDIIKLMSAKRKQLAGTQEAKIIRTPEKYEIDNLKYEAEHVPSAMLPPKEIEDVTKYSWGLTEPEAVKRYTDRERKKQQSNIDYTNKQKVELDAMAKDKPWVLLTRAEIQKRYSPEEAEQKSRDLWTYKTKKSDYEKNADSARFWQSKVDKIDSGEWQKINTNYLREQYQKEVKEAIKHGKPVPFDIIKQYPEFTKAQDNRERYDKGRHTSFANVSIAVDKTHQENTGVKIKRQDGKALDEKTADDVVKALSQFQSVVGDITSIMKREDLTIAHTGKKHPFLSTAAGIYHGTDVTISLGAHTGAHEIYHFLDETAKRRHKDQPLYDYNLIAFAKKNMNGGVYAIERALSLSKYKSPEELEEARNLRYMLGSYWKRVEEVMARLIEQYTAYKNKGIQGTELLHYSYELYVRTPAYWDDVTFMGMLPQIEAELQRKIKLAKE